MSAENRSGSVHEIEATPVAGDGLELRQGAKIEVLGPEDRDSDIALREHNAATIRRDLLELSHAIGELAGDNQSVLVKDLLADAPRFRLLNRRRFNLHSKIRAMIDGLQRAGLIRDVEEFENQAVIDLFTNISELVRSMGSLPQRGDERNRQEQERAEMDMLRARLLQDRENEPSQ